MNLNIDPGWLLYMAEKEESGITSVGGLITRMKNAEPLVCMDCGKEANDAPGGWETDEEGDVWIYCRSCDVWTSHPPEMIGCTREECKRRK